MLSYHHYRRLISFSRQIATRKRKKQNILLIQFRAPYGSLGAFSNFLYIHGKKGMRLFFHPSLKLNAFMYACAPCMPSGLRVPDVVTLLARPLISKRTIYPTGEWRRKKKKVFQPCYKTFRNGRVKKDWGAKTVEKQWKTSACVRRASGPRGFLFRVICPESGRGDSYPACGKVVF